MLVTFAVALSLFSALVYALVPDLRPDNAVLWFVACLSLAGGAAAARLFVRNGDRRVDIWLPCGLVALVLVAGYVYSSGMNRHEEYRALLGEEAAADFKHSLPPLSLNAPGLVSAAMAHRAAEKMVSEVPGLGSVAQVAHLEKQIVNGELVWVGFLEHRGFFAWWKMGATPGYVVVSANDASKVKLVRQIDGSELNLKYIASGYFGSRLDRHLRSQGYWLTPLADFSPETDDSGRPYWVATAYNRTIGFSGPNAYGVVLLDPQSGKTQFYKAGEVPAWVDRVQPAGFVGGQIADRLEYIHGWFNPSKRDQLVISGSMDLVYGRDGRAYFYAGITSTAKEGGLVGFYLVDARSKSAVRYTLSGATEDVAQSAATGVIPEKRYNASNALPFTVDGVPVYAMSLLDHTGIARAFGVVSIESYQRVAVADTLDAAVRLFESKRSLDRAVSGAGESSNVSVANGVVVRIATELRDGNSSYVLLVRGFERLLFSAHVSRSDDLSLTQAGDLVDISFPSTGGRVRAVLEFKNLTLARTAGTGAEGPATERGSVVGATRDVAPVDVAPVAPAGQVAPAVPIGSIALGDSQAQSIIRLRDRHRGSPASVPANRPGHRKEDFRSPLSSPVMPVDLRGTIATP